VESRRHFENLLVGIGVTSLVVVSVLSLTTGIDAADLSHGSRTDFWMSIVASTLAGLATAILASRTEVRDRRRVYRAATLAAGVAFLYAVFELIGSY
jgi:hypothetical protein